MTPPYYGLARPVEIIKLLSNFDVKSEDFKETLPAAKSPRTVLTVTRTFPLGTRCPLVLEIAVKQGTSSEVGIRAY
ncbi:hypothetical protein HKD37_14G040672 [Glycine soja]